MTRQIALKEKGYSLTSPKQMTELATLLKTHIVRNKLYTTIRDKNYAHVEGWQFAGGMMGLFPRVVETTDLSKGNEYKWLSKVEIVNIKDQTVVSTGFAICSSSEMKSGKKVRNDEYSVLSMAQTRAIGKAYRNMLGWVMKLAGMEGTPSEEMHKMGEEPKEATVEYGSVPGPDNDPVFTCQKCAEIITPEEAKYSTRLYGKRLCKEHQEKAMTVLAAKKKK